MRREEARSSRSPDPHLAPCRHPADRRHRALTASPDDRPVSATCAPLRQWPSGKLEVRRLKHITATCSDPSRSTRAGRRSWRGAAARSVRLDEELYIVKGIEARRRARHAAPSARKSAVTRGIAGQFRAAARRPGECGPASGVSPSCGQPAVTEQARVRDPEAVPVDLLPHLSGSSSPPSPGWKRAEALSGGARPPRAAEPRREPRRGDGGAA